MSISRFSYRISLSLVVAVGLAACLVVMALWATDAQAKKGATVPRENAEPPRAEGCPAGGCRLFGQPTFYKAGQDPSFVATADFNQDGHADLLVLNEHVAIGGGFVFVLLGRGDGTFHEAVGYSALDGADQAVIGDFFGDSNLDLILNNGTLYIGQGGGTFSNPVGQLTPLFQALKGEFLATADFNRDNLPDLAHTIPYDPLAIRDSNRVQVKWGCRERETCIIFENNKDRPSLLPGEKAMFIEVADLNRDGVPDIATANEITHDVSIVFANPDGTFPPTAQHVYDGGNSPQELTAADFTLPGTGLLDLVGTNPSSDKVSFFQNSVGEFKEAVEIQAVQGATSPLAADFNGDKTPDLAVAYQNKVAVLLHTPYTSLPPEFQAPDSYNAGDSDAVSLATADFNEDGRPDLAVALEGPFVGENNGGVSVLLNAAGTPPAGTPPVGDAECDIAGTGGKDVLTGTSADETICGSGGMDTIDGGGGNDTLDGGNGKDTLDARDGTGGDTLIGGRAKDSCMGDADDTEQSC